MGVFVVADRHGFRLEHEAEFELLFFAHHIEQVLIPYAQKGLLRPILVFKEQQRVISADE